MIPSVFRLSHRAPRTSAARDGLLTVAATALAMLWVTTGFVRSQLTPASELQAKRPPNILLLIADDLGVDGVGAYGEHPDPPNTPYIDLLAANGTLFRNCWANPGCSPTRATMLTGRYSFRTGIGQAISYLSSLTELSPDELGIPKRLSNTYRSAALGKWHLATRGGTGLRHPQRFGFDLFSGSMKIFPGFIGDTYYNWPKLIDGQFVGSTTYATTDTVNDALAFIDETDDPWFLWVAFHAPHAPYHKPPDNLHSYALPPAVADDVPMHMYAMTEALDTEIGRLILSMDPVVRDNTLIIFVGDNGSPAAVTVPPSNPQHGKNTVYEGGLNVPLIVAGPGVTRGAECAGLVNTTDVFATILESAHAEVPGFPPQTPRDSVTLTPYFADPGRPSLRQWVYAERFEPNGINPTETRRAMREARFKLIQSLHVTDGIIAEELYDLDGDPAETTNLLDFQALPQPTMDVLTMLRDELELLDPSLPWREFTGSGPAKQSAPQLTGSGVPTPGSALNLQLSDAPPNTLGLLVACFQPPGSAIADGVVAPQQQHSVPVRSDHLGRLALAAVWPERATREGALLFQVVFPDARQDAGPLATSNTLRFVLR